MTFLIGGTTLVGSNKWCEEAHCAGADIVPTMQRVKAVHHLRWVGVSDGSTVIGTVDLQSESQQACTLLLCALGWPGKEEETFPTSLEAGFLILVRRPSSDAPSMMPRELTPWKSHVTLSTSRGFSGNMKARVLQEELLQCSSGRGPRSQSWLHFVCGWLQS